MSNYYIGVIDLDSKRAEKIALKLSKSSGVEVDWHYYGGKAAYFIKNKSDYGSVYQVLISEQKFIVDLKVEHHLSFDFSKNDSKERTMEYAMNAYLYLCSYVARTGGYYSAESIGMDFFRHWHKENGVWFITAYEDLTEEEFQNHYKPKLDELIWNGCGGVILNDLQGGDMMLQNYFKHKQDYLLADIYHAGLMARRDLIRRGTTVSFNTQDHVDIACVTGSQNDLIYVRDGDTSSRMYLLKQMREKYNDLRDQGYYSSDISKMMIDELNPNFDIIRHK